MTEPMIEECIAWVSGAISPADRWRITEATLAYLRDHARLGKVNAQMLEVIKAALDATTISDVTSAYQILKTATQERQQ